MKKMVILDFVGSYLCVKKVSGSFTEIGAPNYFLVSGRIPCSAMNAGHELQIFMQISAP